MKVKNVYFVLCAAYFIMGTGTVCGAQASRFIKFAVAARIAAVEAFKQNSLVKKVTAGADILVHNAHSYLSKYSSLKPVLPLPQKKIFEIGKATILQENRINRMTGEKEPIYRKFTLAQENGIDPMTGEEKPFYTMLYCDGKISEGGGLGRYFFYLKYELSTDALHLSPADNNKLALATLNSHPNEVIDSLYFSSILPHLTSETDRVFYTQKLIANEKIKFLYTSELEKIFELLPSEHRSRLAAECLTAAFHTFHFKPSIVFLIKQLWMEEDAFLNAKKLLEGGVLSGQLSSEGSLVTTQTVLDIFTTPEQKNRFAFHCLQDPFSLRAEDVLILIEQLLLPSDRAECAERYVVGRDSYYLLRALLEYIPSDRKNLIALRDLEKSFKTLGNSHAHYNLSDLNDRIGIMIKNLILESDVFHYLEKRMDASYTQAEQLSSLLDYLTNEQKNRFILKKFDKSFDSLKNEHIACMIQRLSCEKDKVCYTKKFIDSGKYTTFEPAQLEKFCGFFAQPILEKSFDALNEVQIGALIPHLSESVQAEWFKKLATSEKATFLSVCAPTTPAQGPLFSDYSLTRLPLILGWMAEGRHSHTDYSSTKESRQHFFDRITKFTEGEYHKDRIVLYHGQNDLWAFLEKIFKAVIFTSQGIETPEKFVWLRWTLQPLLTDKQVAEIRAYGACGKSGKEFNNYRFKVLFTNLHLLANSWGSNSLLYTLTNSDQSAGSRFDFDKGISALFAELGMTGIYKKLRTEEPNLFNRLYDLYKKEVHSRGNVGRLIAFSLPRDIACALCYPTASGAGVRPLKINGKPTTDITEIADHFGQVPDRHEFCLIADKCITNPQEAAQAGVIMETFTSAPTEESQTYAQELDVEFNKMIERTVQLLGKRVA
jgi:hypothetical protein